MALAYSNVKSLKPVRGIREAIIDITLDGAYVNGGWSITGAALLNYSGIANLIYDLIPPISRGGYEFEWDPVAGNASGKLKALQGGVSESFYEAALAEFTTYPTYTATEQAAALCKVYSVTEAGYANISASNTDFGDTYAAEYQFFPDADADVIGDAVYFGGAAPMPLIGIDMSATVAVWTGTPVLWEYYTAAGWVTLPIVYDGTGSTGTDGTTPFEQDGTIVFGPAPQWASSTIDSQAAYWCRAKLGAAGVSTPPLSNSTEHDLHVLTTGYVPTRDGVVTSLFINNENTTEHTANDIKGVFFNSTTGQTSGEWTFKMDISMGVCPLPSSVAVNIGDKCGIHITQEDGTNEPTGCTIQVNYGQAEALANDKGLQGLVVRCKVTGT
jgi:hypothetical protein